ncbi:hypothetical protein PoB_006800800 [Plakobranchus ocellatus]|uniref:Uncharacterized protein n=1 Tax=Plakobranchus ocellatus TaxID=259542 RepID=A0AAV4DB66_9GAST|nr:hypothetical protein PoB_006800800 [Plakobranchus ocellatus]
MAPTEDAEECFAPSWERDPVCAFHSLSSPSPPSSPRDQQFNSNSGRRNPLELSLNLQDLDNTCEIYFCGRDSSPALNTTGRQLAVPEASAAFRKAMGSIETLDLLGSSPSPKTPISSSPHSSPRLPAAPSSSSLTAPLRSPTSSKHQSSSSTSSSSSSSSSPSPSTPPTPTLAAALSLYLSLLKPDKPRRSKSGSKAWQPSVFLPSIFPSSSQPPAIFGEAEALKQQLFQRRGNHAEKHVSWADEFGSRSKLTSVRLIRPRLNVADAGKKSDGIVITPGRSILRDTGAK